MADKGTTKSKAPAGKKLPVSTIIAGVMLLPAAYYTFRKYQEWSVVSAASSKVTAEVTEMKERNASLAVAYEILQNKKFQVCNKSAYPLHIAWLSATYQEGKVLKVFDSSRCEAWQTQEVAPGENKNLFLSSGQEGCNWGGTVIYYAMRFTRETDEASVPYTMVGRYAGFDRDCFTVQ
jgi:hypothetical protein